MAQIETQATESEDALNLGDLLPPPLDIDATLPLEVQLKEAVKHVLAFRQARGGTIRLIAGFASNSNARDVLLSFSFRFWIPASSIGPCCAR